MSRRRSSTTRRSCRVSHRRSTRPFACGRVRGDVADRRAPAGSRRSGSGASALELFLEAPVDVIAHEDAEAIAVERHGQSVPEPARLAQQREVAVQVFGGAEVQGQDGAGRVIDRAEQEERASPCRASQTDCHRRARGSPWPGGAGGGLGLAGSAAAFGRPAHAPSEAPDGVAADRQPLDLAELLRAVAVIEVPVGSLDQLQHALSDLDIERPRRRPAPQAVDQPPDALGPIPHHRASGTAAGLIFKPRAPAAVVIVSATANCTRPGRRASLRLIVTVSHDSMGGHSYSTVREDISIAHQEPRRAA